MAYDQESNTILQVSIFVLFSNQLWIYSSPCKAANHVQERAAIAEFLILQNTVAVQHISNRLSFYVLVHNKFQIWHSTIKINLLSRRQMTTNLQNNPTRIR
ncbi:hypothetical protein ACKWTF_001289 [Chironomus riparius]